MDIDLVQAQWTLGRFPHEQLPSFAGDAMVLGFDGPCVLELASYDRPTLHLLTNSVVEAAFREMGRPPLSSQEAALRLARETALRVLRHQLSPVDGGEEILEVINWAGHMNVSDQLRDFWYSMDELAPDSRRYSERVIELAWELVNEGSAP